MREINNMGGILFADILYKNEISLFAVHQNTACIQIIKGHDWHRLLQWVSLNLLLLPRTNQRQELHINIQQQLNFPKHCLLLKQQMIYVTE